MNIGTLQIEIAANVARLQKDMEETKRAVSGAMRDVEGSVASAKMAFAALTGIGSAAAFIGIVNGAIDAKAKLYDLSLQTGISVEQLGGLAKVAKFANTPLEEVASASNKLSKALATQNEDSKGAAQAIQSLGLDYKKFKDLGADQQLEAVAKAMDRFQDGTGKTAAAMLLFGKTGATLLPFMKELAERGVMVSQQTTASALAAKQYQDNLVEIKGAGEGWALSIANSVLPALVSVTRELTEGRKAYGGWIPFLSDLANFSTLGNANSNIAAEIQTFKKLGAEIDNLRSKIDSGGLWSSMFGVEMKRQLKHLTEQQETIETRIAYMRNLQNDAGAGAGRGFTVPGAGEKPKVTGLGGEATAAKDDFAPLLKQINERVALERAEFDSTTRLTEVQKLQVKVFDDIDNGVVKLTLDQKLRIDALLQEALGLEKLNDAEQRNQQWLEESRKENERMLNSQDRRLQAYQDEAAAAQRQLDEYGMSREELQALESARTRDTAATLRQRAAVLDSAGPMGDLRQLYLDQADALDQLAQRKDALAAKEARDRNDPATGAAKAIKKYIDDVKAAGIATERVVGNALQDLEDRTTNLFTKGKFGARDFIDTLISEFIRLRVVKPLLADIFSPGGGSTGAGLFSLASSIGSFLGFRAEGGGVQGGSPYVVGEQGPELFVPDSSGTVVPNKALGGSQFTYAPVIHIDSRSDRAQVAQLVGQAVAQGNQQFAAQLRAQGVL